MNSTAPSIESRKKTATYDVIIVGAGLSGIGTAYWLQKRCPNQSYAIFEAREAIGGTWDLFRYPGVRSDSDMFTFGYAFRPWQDPKPLADGESIRNYIYETARENGIDKKIRFGHKVINASWSTEDACWTLDVQTVATGETQQVRSRFLMMCSGYYDYKQAHRPDFEGEQEFKGKIVQPQFWPEDLDYTDKKVVIVGSGATAVTLVPSMADKAAHVTMLQRSPTYITPLPNSNGLYRRLNKWLPNRLAYKITRWRNLLFTMGFYKLSRAYPGKVKQYIMDVAEKQLGPGHNVRKHFNPHYNPWDQRLCVIPDGDLFKAIRKEQASVVTDHIERFTEKGIRLKSGKELEADVVVLATGLKVKLLGGAQLEVDGEMIHTRDRMAYRGMMMSDIPNFALAFGYTNASWTLKTDLTANYVCRLINYMDRRKKDIVVPRKQKGVSKEPFLDFDAGYIKRAGHILPQQGSRKPWRVYQNYLKDMLTIRYSRFNDGVLKFGRKGEKP